jgi:peptide/nickel transport system substrate-binding protein
VVCGVLAAGCTRVSESGPGAAASGVQPQSGNAFTIAHTLRIGDNQNISTLNPHLGTAASLSNIAQLEAAWLLRSNGRNQPVPELATEVPAEANGGISKDGLTITWHLRRGVKWSDGAPFDADDLVFSTRAVLNKANNEVGRNGFDLITKIDEPDKYTVVYHLRKKYAAFWPTFFSTGGANPSLLPKHVLGALPNINDAPFNSLPIGIGPFRVTKWVRDDRVELEANPYYWRGKPKLAHIVYRFLPDRNTLLTQMQTGEIDLWPYAGTGFVDRVKAIPTAAVVQFPGFFYGHLDFNMQHAVFRDLAVRQALRLAIDRPTILAKVNHGAGVVSETPMTPVSPVFTAFPVIPFDLTRANALLDGAGWKRGADGIRLKGGKRLALVMAAQSGNPDGDELIEQIRGTWSRLGVDLQLRRYQPSLFFALQEQGGIIYSGKFDVTFFYWQLDPTGDLSNLLACDQIPPDGQNVDRYCDPKLDAAVKTVLATYDVPKRRAAVANVVRILIANVPQVVLYIRDDIHAYNRDLHGWHPNAIAPFDDLMDVDIGSVNPSP